MTNQSKNRCKLQRPSPAQVTKTSERSEVPVEIHHLVMYHHHGDSCYPSIDRIAQKASTSARTVQRVLAKFRDWGLIMPVKNSQGGCGRTVHYQINVEMLKKGDK